MIKLTEKQKQVVKVYMGSDADTCDTMDECTNIANALLRHKEFDLIQNSITGSAMGESMTLLSKFGCPELYKFVVVDGDNTNSWLEPGAHEHEFYAAREQFIKEAGL
jgi:hypothetical protein